MAQYRHPDLESARTLIFVAWIFAILGFIADVFLLVLLWWTIIGAIFPIIGIWVFSRINNIKAALDKGDVETASKLNTTLFGIIAIFFGGVVPGILLLVAKGNIDRVTSQRIPTPPTPSFITETYCTYCGVKNPIDAKYCKACGKELKK
ncbi:MAG: zinc ribbon domain-containing protein [Nitrososphaeria archaeon]